MIGQEAPQPVPADEAARVSPADSGIVPERLPVEIGGREGPEPTRYGDWEKNGRCIDF